MTPEEMKGIIAEELKALPKGISKEEMIKAIDEKMEGFKQEVSKQDFDDLKKSLEEIGTEIAKQSKGNKTAEPVSIAKAIVDMFNEQGFTSIQSLKNFKGGEIELKADNPLIAANMTGTYGLTQQVSQLRFAPVRPYAFIGNGIRGGSLDQDKNILLWVTGNRTNNVAYIGELADANTTVDGSTITAAEKTRQLSGIVGRAIITNRSFEDLSQLAQRVQTGLMEAMELHLDQKIWDGEGNDATKPNEIYGVKTGQVTAFNPTLVPQIKSANVSDLAAAAALQAKLNYHTCNTVWMSETLAFKLQRTKDTTGQYIINKLVDGTMMMGGLRVITTELFGGATEKMLVGDPAKIQFWVKRGLTAEFERVAKSDSFNLYVYARQQVLVEDEDRKGLIYIADVTKALAAIDPDVVDIP